MKEREIIVVLGMHRSGTSAITRSLDLLGVDLGDSLHPAAADNPKGFWEDKECLQINEDLLALLNSSYDKLAFTWNSFKDLPQINLLRLKAAQLIESKLRMTAGTWGFKDPRTCRLLSFWQEVFSITNCKVSYIIAVRNPASIADSLESRNAIPAEKSYLLWLQHILPAVLQTKGENRVIVDFDEFLDSPYKQLCRIATVLGLKVPTQEDPKVLELMGDFLDRDLRHSRYTHETLSVDARANKLVIDTHRLLELSARDEVGFDLESIDEKLQIVQQELKQFSPAFNYINLLETERQQLWMNSADLQSQRARLAEENSKLTEEIKAATQRNSELEMESQQLLALSASVREESISNLKAIDSKLFEVQKELKQLAPTLNDVQLESQRLLSLSALLREESTSNLKALDDKLFEVQAELKQLTPTLNDTNLLKKDREFILLNTEGMKSQQILLLEENRKLNSDNSAIALRNDELACQSQHQAEIIASQHNELAGLNQRVSDLEREIHQILISSSWRVTKPLRLIRRVFHRLLSGRLRSALRTLAFALWRRLPLKSSNKANLKSFLFNSFPLLFKNLDAYKRWHDFNSIAHETPLPARSSLAQGERTYVPILQAAAPESVPARVIAFYLPQFHAIKENNEWWGEGFTEWTNVRPAQPQFEGHYQPHLPGELGYYSLLDRSTQLRQIELAKLYGIGGFCFYYYWFGGKRLLEKPIENYLADPTLDHPFCLCWANENWSRRWDGKDADLLIAQQHSPEDDLDFAADVARYMRDARYIRIDGKPLLIIYRPSLLPSPHETVQRWREYFRNCGLGEVYLAYTQSFEAEDPRKYGLDAAIEFPPNNSAPPNITSEIKPLSDSFTGTVYDWSILAKRSYSYKEVPYKLFRSVCPSWDNTARRKGNGTIFLNSTPQDYQGWLENAITETCKQAKSPDERLIFVNAWNEWAEGAHLEPDQKYGYAWLDATRNALTKESEGPFRRSVAVVVHDAHPHGAQFLASSIIRTLSHELKLDTHTILLGEGKLRDDYAANSKLHELYPGDDWEERSRQLAHELHASGVRHAIVNTTVSGKLIRVLNAVGIECISLVHEMPGVISSMQLTEQAADIAKYSKKVVFAATAVEEGFHSVVDLDQTKCVIRPQGLYRHNLLRFRKAEARAAVRKELNISTSAPMILGVGYADHRKGVDIFAAAGLELLKKRPDAIFVWVGHWDAKLKEQVDQQTVSHRDSFRFVGYRQDTAPYYAASDIFALTSREDPFPSVVLEAFDAGVPVAAFAGTGGGADLAARIGGRTADSVSPQAFAKTLLEMLKAPKALAELAEAGSRLVDEQFSFRHYIFDLCGYLNIELPKVSVVIPNYNYANHIKDRLDSIRNQSLPVFEYIILDDASTDQSIREITDWLDEHRIEARLITNAKNSGNVFDQWAKGIALAKGDYIWIAEADDLADADFLAVTLQPLKQHQAVVLSYCESQQIDEYENVLAKSYKDYYSDVCSEHWSTPFINDGKSEICEYLSIKNTIPNVSGVLFRREILAKVFIDSHAEIRSLKRAGDWLTYIKVLDKGDVAFSPLPLNLHRRHSKSVVAGANGKSLIKEISDVQALIAKEQKLPQQIRERSAAYIFTLQQSLS